MIYDFEDDVSLGEEALSLLERAIDDLEKSIISCKLCTKTSDSFSSNLTSTHISSQNTFEALCNSVQLLYHTRRPWEIPSVNFDVCFQEAQLQRKFLTAIELIVETPKKRTLFWNAINKYGLKTVGGLVLLAEMFRPSNCQKMEILISKLTQDIDGSSLIKQVHELSFHVVDKLEKLMQLISSPSSDINRYDAVYGVMCVAASIEAISTTLPNNLACAFWKPTIDNKQSLGDSLQSVYLTLVHTATDPVFKSDNLLSNLLDRARLFTVASIVEGLARELWDVSRVRLNGRIQHTISADCTENSQSVETFLNWILSFEEHTNDTVSLLRDDFECLGATHLICEAAKMLYGRSSAADCITCMLHYESTNASKQSQQMQTATKTKEIYLEFLSNEQREKIRLIKEIMGNDLGDGYIYLCLRENNFNVERTTNTLLDVDNPAAMSKQIDCQLTLDRVLDIICKPKEKVKVARGLSAVGRSQSPVQESSDAMALTWDDKTKILMLDAAYEDEYDDTLEGTTLQIEKGNVDNASDGDEAEENNDEVPNNTHAVCETASTPRNESKGPQHTENTRGGRGRVRGQTYQARRKEHNKSKIANHNRRSAHLAKMRRGAGSGL